MKSHHDSELGQDEGHDKGGVENDVNLDIDGALTFSGWLIGRVCLHSSDDSQVLYAPTNPSFHDAFRS